MRRAPSTLSLAPLLLAACGGAPSLADLPGAEKAPVCRAFAAEPATGFGCRAEDVPGVRDAPVYLATVEFRADGRVKRFLGLRPKVGLTALPTAPPSCVDAELKLLRTDPPRAVLVPITLRYRAAEVAGRDGRFEAGRCVLDIALVAP